MKRCNKCKMAYGSILVARNEISRYRVPNFFNSQLPVWNNMLRSGENRDAQRKEVRVLEGKASRIGKINVTLLRISLS